MVNRKLSSYRTFKLIITIRGDFYGHAVSHKNLSLILQDSTLPVGPMNRKEIKDTIVKPAQKMNVDIQPELISELLEDIGNDPERIALLEFALTLLWEKQIDGELTLVSYKQFGGLEKTLTHHADKVF